MFIDFRERKRERGRGYEQASERERGGGREEERNIDWLPPVHALTQDQTCNLGMCPDWKIKSPTFWCMGQHSN